MAGVELVVIAIPFVVAALLVSRAPGIASGLLFAREVVFGVFALILALTLIGTGYGPAMAIGAIMLFFIALWVFVNKPYDEVT